MRSIYLDYSTTTPVAASVREKMLPFLSEFYGHPASCHWYGRAAQEAIEDARSNVATLLGCHPSEIIFTSGGTESVNLGILGVARTLSRTITSGRPHLIVSTLDHACVHQCAERLEAEGWQVSLVDCDDNGVVRLDEIRKTIRDTTRLISIIHASHRIGTIQPIRDISDICRENDILLHTDAAQSAGKIHCQVDELGVDLLSLSGHKLYAPKGVGVLFSRLGVPLEPILYGEGSESGMRAGTSNVLGIVGLGQAAKLAQLGLTSSTDRLSEMRDRFHRQLETLLGCEIKVHGDAVPRVPGILSIELPHVTAEALQQRLPEICFGPALRSHHSARQRIHNFGPTEQQSAHTLRLSFGWTTSEDELQQALQLIAAAYEALVE